MHSSISQRTPLGILWSRISSSRTTALYFTLALGYCCIQIILQVAALSVNEYATDFMTSVIRQGNVSDSLFPILESNGPLRLCPGRQAARDLDSCAVVWPVSDNQSVDSLQYFKAVILEYGDNQTMELNRGCVAALAWPQLTLHNTELEDKLYLGFQVWLLVVSLLALLCESIPHTVAALLMHLSACIWSSVQLVTVVRFRSDFERLIIKGACNGRDLLPGYFKSRIDSIIGEIVVDVVALFGMAYLAWALVGLFGWKTFTTIGASVTIQRTYKLALSFWISIQLTLYFLIGFGALWLDQLFSGAFGFTTTNDIISKVLLISAMALLVPWLALGWFGVRYERRILMAAFHVLSLFYLIGLINMLRSTSFRITFVNCRFFGLVSVGASFTIICTITLGVACCFHFGKGLPDYICKASDKVGVNDLAFRPSPDTHDEEKIMFPVAFRSSRLEADMRSERSMSVYDSSSTSTLASPDVQSVPVHFPNSTRPITTGSITWVDATLGQLPSSQQGEPPRESRWSLSTVSTSRKK